MKQIKIVLVGFLLSISVFGFSQNAAASKDSVKTDIIEMDSTVAIKSVQVTTVVVTSTRVNQELERYRQEEATLEQKLKDVRSQIKEFERLLGGIIVTEKRIEEKMTAKREKEKQKEELKPATTPSEEPKKKKETATKAATKN